MRRRSLLLAACLLTAPAIACAGVPGWDQLKADLASPTADVHDAAASGLRDMAEKGQHKAAVLLAEDLVARGDAAGARQVLIEASAREGFPAWMKLGDMLATGAGGEVDAKGAFDAYGRAAAAGNPWGHLRVARMYRDGTGVEADAGQSLHHFEAALAAGGEAADMARRDLIGGHLGGKFGSFSDPEAGTRLASDAMGTQDMKMAFLLARLPVEIPGVDEAALGPLREKALSLVSAAAEAGDPAAVAALFDHWAARARTSREAEASLAELVRDQGALLDASRLVKFGIQDGGARMSPQERRDMVAKLEGLTGKDYLNAFGATGINPNLRLQAIQSLLAKAGYYDGKADGLLGLLTIKAMNRFCRHNGLAAECKGGPLSYATGRAIAERLVF
ncbi:hypothetical protein LAZ40_09450 [Cereibacter sphaeroides]|uniref:SEL1-like repeat protein n=1 Tax=Cereibacter sphaeroides TaxID=1063 RepID=UPI001F2CC717|nr:peptidoglycan-binding protein [Cereibacter sphaeroides]MCE6959277.1 hypothetical protein [Cereibacter sphaeroides]MCE6972869.1 hypothetical protein [Cereibacter sphaeroides]